MNEEVKIETSSAVGSVTKISLSNNLIEKLDQNGEVINNLTEEIDKIEVTQKKSTTDLANLLERFEKFIKKSKEIKVQIPYEEGYLRAIGATKTVTLSELIGEI